eukprot:jgi/Botrbrau1/14779/Bobra.0284s0012.1
MHNELFKYTKPSKPAFFRFRTALCSAGTLVIKTRVHLPPGPDGAAFVLNCTREQYCTLGGFASVQEAWEGACGRLLLSQEAVAVLLRHMEDNKRIPIETARYIKAGDKYVSDVDFYSYHGMGLLNASELLHPGALTIESSIPLKGIKSSSEVLDQLGECVHGFPSLQAVPSDSKVPSNLNKCIWDEAACCMQLSLRLNKPFYPAWVMPPKPSKPLSELIPPREAAAKAIPTPLDILQQKLRVHLSHYKEVDSLESTSGPTNHLDRKEMQQLVDNVVLELRRDRQSVSTGTSTASNIAVYSIHLREDPNV